MKVPNFAKKIYQYVVAIERAEDFDAISYMLDRIAKIETDVAALKTRYSTPADGETAAFV